MHIKSVFSMLSGGVFLLGFFPYIWAVVHGKASPSKSSWIIWATLNTVMLAGMYASDTTNGQILAAAVGAWIVVFLALKRGTSVWSMLDKACLLGAVLGIVLWVTFASPVLAILSSAGVVFLGSIPTFKSAWEDPSRESLAAWSCYWISCIISLMEVSQWTLANATQPVVFFVMDSIVMFLLLRPRKQMLPGFDSKRSSDMLSE